MAPTASADDRTDLLIEDILIASRTVPKARATNIKPTVAELTSQAYDKGLLPESLDRLIDLVTTPTHLDQASLASIVRNLYPATRISRDVVLRVVASLGHGTLKPSLNVQAALVRWLILIHHRLEDSAVLSRVYHVLFNLLDTAAIRPLIAHLLALVTRRKHVRPFRIQAVLTLTRQTGNDPCLVGLLRVFKDYYPEIIVGEAVRGKASAFKHPDPQWRLRLDEIQEAHVQNTQEGLTQPRDGFRVNRPLHRFRKNKLLPVVQTSHAKEDSVTLEEVDSATRFAQTIDRVELPNQLVAVLADPLLQKLLLLRPSDAAHQRIANWLNSVLQDVLDGDADEATLGEVLDIVRDFVTQSKTLPPVVLNFFTRYLPVWHGSERRDCILDILAHVPMLDFDELYQHIFRPLEEAILDNTPESQLSILGLYTRVLHHWTAILAAAPEFPQDGRAITSSLTKHVNILTYSLLQTSPTLSTQFAILDFYDQTARLNISESLKYFTRIELPPAALIYTLFFSSSLAVLSRLLWVLSCYKTCFEDVISSRKTLTAADRVGHNVYQKSYVDVLNIYLMDLCNCLWRYYAFENTGKGTYGCLIPGGTTAALESYVTSVDRSFSLGSLFTIGYSPVLCLQSILPVRELEEAAMDDDDEAGSSIRARHAGPVSFHSLTRLANAGGIQLSWQDYRLGVLDRLASIGMIGVGDFLKKTITVLRNSQEAGTQNSTLNLL